MPTTVPAMRGEFGTNKYWITALSVGELVKMVQFPQDLPGWDTLSIEGKYQREINVNRVRGQITPYFAGDEDRFSGSLVLAVMNSESMVFEPLTNIGGGWNRVPQLYQSAAQNLGFLTLHGGEVLVPLDGQHRAKAFKFAINGADDYNRSIAGVKANPDLAKDVVPVILVEFDALRARLIFNKLNRYAKPTTIADNLITDDDDAVASITRDLLGEDGAVPSRLVRIGGNTLPAPALEFTTLATIYEANLDLISTLGIVGKGSPKQMNADQRELVLETIRPVWEAILSRIDLFARALADPTEKGDGIRVKIREETLLGKPIGQRALIRGYSIMRKRCEGVLVEQLFTRLNRINWDVNDTMWHNVLMNPNGRVLSGKGTINLAGMFVAHLGGAKLTEEETQQLLERIHGQGWQNHSLPEPVA